MSNISSIIAGHNKSLIQPQITKYECNCRVKNTPNLIYRADVENKINDEKNIYFGYAATTFKERFGNHKKDFNHKQPSKNI